MAVLPVLKRFDVYIYKQKGGGDPALVPADDAALTFFKQGATAAAGALLPYLPPEPTEIPVFNTGAIAAGDQLMVNGDQARLMTVVLMSIRPDTYLTVRNDTSADIVVAANDRLIVKSKQFEVYKGDPLGESDGVMTLNAEEDTGRARAYLREFRYDALVNVPGEALRVFPDGIGSFVLRT